MNLEIITKEDLQQFRQQLLDDIRQLLNRKGSEAKNDWLKNKDVKTLLQVSSNTIQRLRITGQLKSTKIGGIHYYRYEDIQFLLDGGFKGEEKKP